MPRSSSLAPSLALLLMACTNAGARTVPAASDDALARAIASANDGDVIQLAPGNYGALVIKGAQHAVPVQIRGAGAKVKSVEIQDAAGWTLEELHISGGFGPVNRVVSIQNSQRIVVRNNLIEGLNPNSDPWDDETVGIGIRTVSQSVVEGNRFRDLSVAAIVLGSQDIRFEGNSIAYVREGVNWVSVQTGVIRCNRFSHFFPNYKKSEHPDAIQGWWYNGPNNSDLLIEGNFINVGGPRAVQGIFFAGARLPVDDYVNGKLRRLTVRDNVYYGSALHGISVSGTEDALLERNTVLPSPHALKDPPPTWSADGRRSIALGPSINFWGDVSTGRSVNNIAAGFVVTPKIKAEGNLQVTGRPGSPGTKWSAVFVSPPTGDDPPLEAFLVDPQSKAGAAGQGARPVCGATLPPALPADSPDPSRDTPAS